MHNSLFIAALLTTSAAPAQLRHFEAKNHSFSADYPDSWNRLGENGLPLSHTKLEIISFPNSERLEATVVREGGAEIILEESPNSARSGDDSVIAHRNISLPSAFACSSIRAIRFVWPVVPPDAIPPTNVNIYRDSTEYKCVKGSLHLTLILSHWKGDLKHNLYEKTALNVLRSVRISKN